jgi:bud site selection protein 20
MPAIRGSKSKSKTRRYKRDLDQIHNDLCSDKHLADYKATKAVEDLPALGQFYCKECSKWFEAEANLKAHLRGKIHKRR